MFYVNSNNLTQKRTLRPLYEPATAYAGYLDPAWARGTDILPGMVVVKLAKEKFTLATTAAQEPFGLSALFVAPTLGIDEVKLASTNAFTVWKGDSQATFEILAPAFDTTADWAGAVSTAATAGQAVRLHFTLTSHASGPGKLTCTVPNGSNANYVSTAVVGQLVDVVGTNKIIVNLDRTLPTALTGAS